jgi:formylglycine-generating enzyme required for sulfatase activity
MSRRTTDCPHCRAQLAVFEGHNPDEPVRCPMCRRIFVIDALPPPRPKSAAALRPPPRQVAAPRRVGPKYALVSGAVLGVVLLGAVGAWLLLRGPARQWWGRGGGEPPGGAKELTNSIGMKLVFVPAGKFLMGSPPDEVGREDDEEPHEVEITRAFHLGAYEVTQEQYEKVVGRNPSYFAPTGAFRSRVEKEETGPFPVENVSWHDAKAFCEKLSALPAEQVAGRSYRLPTEAEWEHACRGGANDRQPFAGAAALSSTLANFDGRYPYGTAARGPYLRRTAKVGSYSPNGLGLYDLHGGVWEWCEDWYAKDYARASPAQDPRGPAQGERRVLRGGSWVDDGKACRAASRLALPPDQRLAYYGFRVVCYPASQGR